MRSRERRGTDSKEGAEAMKNVFVHGLGQTPDSWKPVFSLLDGLWDCVFPDLAAMVSAGEATYAQLYRAFARLCDGLEAPLALCGLSLGGVLSLHYAVEHPERVGSLVLIAPQYKMPKRLLQVQNTLFRLMPRAMFRETGFEKAQFLQLCRSMMELDFSSALSGIACPTLVICGDRDRANRQACKDLARLVKRAELRVVEGAGHELNREAPEKLALLLREFYDRAPEVR